MTLSYLARFGAALACLVALAGAWISPAAAQYPERNITLIVPYGAGGGTDITARMLAQDLEAVLGKPVTVENRAGGGGWVGWGGARAGHARRLHHRLSQCAQHVCRLSRPAI